MPAPTSTPPVGTGFDNCKSPDEPCIYLHSSHTQFSVDGTARLSFSISNALTKPTMLARLTLKLPSGWSMDGEGFANKCSGLCTANHEIPPGDQKYIEATAYPNHTGVFLLEGRVEFVYYEGEEESNFVTAKVPITVRPGIGGDERVKPLPTSPPQPTATTAAPTATPTVPTATPTVIPTATPTAAPTATQAPATSPGGGSEPQTGEGSGNGAGCNAPPPNQPGVVDPSLLLAGLLIPAGILARLGINRRRRNNHRNGG